MIGHEIAALKNLTPASAPAIVLIGDPGLCRRYQLALDLFGLGPVSQASEATEVGLWVLARYAGLVD
nr:2-dehydro-3-deoxygalactonokinase [Herbaspirillum sp. B65]